MTKNTHLNKSLFLWAEMLTHEACSVKNFKTHRLKPSVKKKNIDVDVNDWHLEDVYSF